MAGVCQSLEAILASPCYYLGLGLFVCLFVCFCRLGFPDVGQGTSACLKGHCVLDGIRRTSGALVINTHGDHIKSHSPASWSIFTLSNGCYLASVCC